MFIFDDCNITSSVLKNWRLNENMVESLVQRFGTKYEPCLIIVSFLNDLLLNIIDIININ